MTEQAHKPTEEEIISFIGRLAEEAWKELKRFIEDNYGLEPEIIFYGKKYGWTVRYRKSGKTLCSLFPERGGFTVLVVFGKKESEKALLRLKELSIKIKKLLGETEQLRDGRWLWIRLLTKNEVDDVKKLLQIKRRIKRI